MDLPITLFFQENIIFGWKARSIDINTTVLSMAWYSPSDRPPRRSQPDSLDLVLGEPLLGAVVELGRARALVRGHFLRVIERAAVGEVGRDPGGAERVAADRLRNAGSRGPSADHPPGIRLAHRLVGEQAAVVTPRRAEQPTLTILGDAGRIDVSVERLGQRVMARHRVVLAAF